MNLFKDMILVNKDTLRKSIKSFRKNWIIIFTGIVYVLLNIFMVILVNMLFSSVFSILAGLVIAIVSSSLISNYLYLLYNIINDGKITLNNFKEGFRYFLWKIYGIFFIAWIGNFILASAGNVLGSNAETLRKIVSIVVIVSLNPLPETVYQKYFSSGESIKYAFEFMKENWINWLVPNALFYLILHLITNKWIFDIFTTHLSFNFDFTVKGVSFYILGQGVFSFIMIYRGYLFKLLSTSTPRKRMYMNKFYD